MARVSLEQLQREHLVMEAVDRLLGAEVSRLLRERDRAEAREWDAAAAAADIAGVRALWERLRAAREAVQADLRPLAAADAAVDEAGRESFPASDAPAWGAAALTAAS